MRIHGSHEILAPWVTGSLVVDPDRLAAVRIEPVHRRRRPALALDLYVSGDSGDAVIPLVLADPAVLVERDRDPLIWPAAFDGGDDVATALAARIVPHLERLVLAGGRIVEHVVAFGPAPRFAAARAAGCFGAAPLRDALARLAPYRYARRFARGRSVRIDAADAVGGWAILRSGCAAGVAAARRDPAAVAWYGEPPSPPRRADLAIVDGETDPGEAACVLRLDADGPGRVEVVDPLPLDVGIVFDPAEGPVRRWFAVERVLEPALRVMPPASVTAGGSAGRIALVLGRGDADRLPSADADEAAALLEALVAEGFAPYPAAGPAEIAGADLVHVLGTRDGRRAREIVEAARLGGIPVAVHAYDEVAEEGGWWGAAVTRHCFDYGSDERDVESYLELLARRAVSIGPAGADAPYAPAHASPADAAAALREATVVFAASEEEAEVIRARRGRGGPIAVVPPLARRAEPHAVGMLVGDEPFAYVHAPIGPIANQLLVARAARDAAIPLVLAGPVADASYLELVREFGGPGLIVLPGEPHPGVAAALRAAAAVAIDAAWVGDGGSRLAAAALAGAQLVLADRRRFALPGAQRCDPGDLRSLARALGAAWDASLRVRDGASAETRTALAPGAAVRAIVRGYALAAAALA